MLTRLKVSGFKNLVDVDISFGPVTCIAGVNGVGKSNLFDAITFLSALAEKPLLDAALSVRDEGGRTTDLRSIFHRVGDTYDDTMSFEAEMIVPSSGVDNLGQVGDASITFLRYTLGLAYRPGDGVRSFGSIHITDERLTYIPQGEARAHLLFPHRPAWRKSAIHGKRFGKEFISTDAETGSILLHQDGGGRGRPRSASAATALRTVISDTNAAESPTALVARNEMRSWRLLHLEPSAMRMPDPFIAPTHLGTDGSHLAATLYHLAESRARQGASREDIEIETARVYAQVANRLADLINDVRDVWVDRDERRELFTVFLKDRYNTTHTARSLSDGTLRFLALTVLELDPSAQGVLCLEEPENGIHPARVPAMLQLLRDFAVDVEEPVAFDNPLRQVIINTHSPVVVSEIRSEDLLMADLVERVDDKGKRFKSLAFRWLPETWRADANPSPQKQISKGSLLAYLNTTSVDDFDLEEYADIEGADDAHPFAEELEENVETAALVPNNSPQRAGKRRVAHHPYLRSLWDLLQQEGA